MGLVIVGPMVIPPPEGADMSTMEGLKEAMPLFGPQHFIFPLLAHALGTLVGAMVAAAIAATHKMRFALAIGAFFLIGGTRNMAILPAPVWFNVLNLVVAYLPMGWIGGRIVGAAEGQDPAVT